MKIRYFIFPLALLLFACSPSNDLSKQTKITSLQAAIEITPENGTLDLANYPDITDKNARVGKSLTISNGSLEGGNLQIAANGVELSGITGPLGEVAALPELGEGDLKIINSEVDSLLIRGGGSNSIVVGGSTIRKITLNKKNVRLHVIDTGSKVTEILALQDVFIEVDHPVKTDNDLPLVDALGKGVSVSSNTPNLIQRDDHSLITFFEGNGGEGTKPLNLYLAVKTGGSITQNQLEESLLNGVADVAQISSALWSDSATGSEISGPELNISDSSYTIDKNYGYTVMLRYNDTSPFCLIPNRSNETQMELKYTELEAISSDSFSSIPIITEEGKVTITVSNTSAMNMADFVFDCGQDGGLYYTTYTEAETLQVNKLVYVPAIGSAPSFHSHEKIGKKSFDNTAIARITFDASTDTLFLLTGTVTSLGAIDAPSAYAYTLRTLAVKEDGAEWQKVSIDLANTTCDSPNITAAGGYLYLADGEKVTKYKIERDKLKEIDSVSYSGALLEVATVDDTATTTYDVVDMQVQEGTLYLLGRLGKADASYGKLVALNSANMKSSETLIDTDFIPLRFLAVLPKKLVIAQENSEMSDKLTIFDEASKEGFPVEVDDAKFFIYGSAESPWY